MSVSNNPVDFLTPPYAPPNAAEDEIRIDGTLLRSVFRRRLRPWAWAAPFALAALTLLGLLLIPQSFTSTTSVAVQEPNASTSALGLLTGASQTKRYLGVLKSREAASQVEQIVHLRQLYDLKTTRDAEDLLMKSIKPEDNAADGLLYIHLTLDGPPRLGLHAAARRAQIKDAAARAANAYAVALRHYYVTSDTDRDSVLVRGADAELLHARAGFDRAQANVGDFVKGLKTVDSQTAPAGGASLSGNLPTAATEMGKLYEEHAQVQADIRAAQAGHGAQQAGVTGQLRNLGRLPSEDPLLTEARKAVDQDQTDIANLSKIYGPDNPNMVVARQKLQVDQAVLDKQTTGIQQSLTTDQVHFQANLQALQAKDQTVLQQIAAAERRFRVGRNLTQELMRLETEEAIQLEVLKTVESEAAKVRVNTVSAQSRMSVIDAAIPAESGQPGIALIVALSAFLVILGFLIAVIRDYLSQARRAMPAPGVNGALPSTNGTGLDGAETAETLNNTRQTPR